MSESRSVGVGEFGAGRLQRVIKKLLGVFLYFNHGDGFTGVQICQAIKLYTLNTCGVWSINYTSTKLMIKKENNHFKFLEKDCGQYSDSLGRTITSQKHCLISSHRTTLFRRLGVVTCPPTYPQCCLLPCGHCQHHGGDPHHASASSSTGENFLWSLIV